MVRRLSAVLTAIMVMLVPAVGSAQTVEKDRGVTLSAAFPGMVVEPGASASFAITVGGIEGARAPLAVVGLPEGWTAVFRALGRTVDRVAVSPPVEGTQDLTLEVDVPGSAQEGTVEFQATAGRSVLDLSVTVRAGAAGAVTLTPDFPGLRGPSDGDFTFKVTLANDTAADVEVELAGSGPDGWNVTAEPTGQSQASAISVAAGDSTTVDLTASPPPGAEAGLYEVAMTATGEGVDAELLLGVELVGDFSMDLTTPDQRLNAEVVVGEPTEFPLVVFNTGSASLLGVAVSGTPPVDWDVIVTPEVVAEIAPGESAAFTASIVPGSDALAGDYDVSFSASAEGAGDSVSIRTTVTPSAVWGVVGVGLIALTLAGLALIFRRFGRR